MKHRVKRHTVVQPLDQSYRLIPLTQGQNAIVDAGDFDWLNQWNWIATKFTNTYGYYARRRLTDGTFITMHRLILGLKDREVGDHINRNSLDNRRCNLRKATPSESCMNRQRRKPNAAGFLGVTKRGDQWGARIQAGNRPIWLGLFPTAKDAALAYDECAKHLHGQFANLNFPL